MYETGCAKLGLVTSLEKVRVVLEADGTEVDDEDYFSFLPNDSILMLLTHTETWRPSGFGGLMHKKLFK